MKYVLFYESSAEGLANAPQHAAAHRALWSEFSNDGRLLMIGPFANPLEGAMGIFTTREAAETFAKRDPFVHHGVAKTWRVVEWNEALA
jgi:uncharacterized protein